MDDMRRSLFLYALLYNTRTIQSSIDNKTITTGITKYSILRIGSGSNLAWPRKCRRCHKHWEAHAP